jgi:hypothetical protein
MEAITKGKNARYISLSEWLVAIVQELPKGQSPRYHVPWYMSCGICTVLHYVDMQCGTKINGTMYYGDLYCGKRSMRQCVIMYYDTLYCGTCTVVLVM